MRTKTASSTAVVIFLAYLASLVPAHAQTKCTLQRVARLPVTMEGLRASVPVTINGKSTRLWLDSGAFFSLMSEAKAAEFALPTENLPFDFYITGVGGSTIPRLANVKSFGIAGASIRNVKFLVGGSDAGNGVLGLNLLAAFDTDYDLANGAVGLMEPKDCGANDGLAYWAGDKTVLSTELLSGADEHDRHIYAHASVNGKEMRVMFDTGAPTTILTRTAAEKAGIDLSAPGVVSSAEMGGIGSKRRKSWIAKLAAFEIGGEQIRNTPVRIIEEVRDNTGSDMVIGADFFLAHHIFVVRSQRRMYFTYNGGPVFSLTTQGEAGKATTRAENMGGADTIADPKNASDFARRGAARRARADYSGAVADLSEAIRQDSKSVDYYRERARAYTAIGNHAAARKDFDAAIALAPDDPALLVTRGRQRLADHDPVGALADAEAAAKLAPPGALENRGLANLFERLHLPERSLALLEAMIAMHKEDPKIGDLLNSRCWEQALANIELDKALADCNAAIRRDGVRADYLDSRAMVYVRQKNYAAAIADYDAALAAKADLPESRYMRGWVNRAMGQAEEGAADIAAAKKARAGIVERFKIYGFDE